MALEQMESFAARLKEKLQNSGEDDENPVFDASELMKLIDRYVKLESQKASAVTTVQKLIKLSTEKQKCFLCKQDLTQKDIKQFEKNFKPDSMSVDQKIVDAKEKMEEAISKCSCVGPQISQIDELCQQMRRELVEDDQQAQQAFNC